MLAAKKGNEDIVKTLIKSGANVNLSDNEGWTPLIAAAYKGHTSIVKLLLASGANKYLRTVVCIALATYTASLLHVPLIFSSPTFHSNFPGIVFQNDYEDVPAGKDAAQAASIAGKSEAVAALKGPIHAIPFVGPALSVIVRPFVNAFREH